MADSDIYTAEKILEMRKTKSGETQYRIKWKGYSYKETTWEPPENILDRTLLINFEQSLKNKKSSPASTSNSTTTSSSTILNSSGTSSNASSVTNESRITSTSTIGKVPKQARVRARRRSYLEQRQEQVQLQRHIELQQQQKTHPGLASCSLPSTTSASTATSPILTQSGEKRPQLLIFNPQGKHDERTMVEEIYEPKLSKEPIVVTDVTSEDLTVTISECETPDGFFRTN